MVVGADGKVAPRPVKVGAAQGDQWVVLDGLKAGEQVMVDGFQKLRGTRAGQAGAVAAARRRRRRAPRRRRCAAGRRVGRRAEARHGPVLHRPARSSRG